MYLNATMVAYTPATPALSQEAWCASELIAASEEGKHQRNRNHRHTTITV